MHVLVCECKSFSASCNWTSNRYIYFFICRLVYSPNFRERSLRISPLYQRGYVLTMSLVTLQLPKFFLVGTHQLQGLSLGCLNLSMNSLLTLRYTFLAIWNDLCISLFFCTLLDLKVFSLQDFDVDALVKFVEETSTPTVTLFNKDPKNHPFVIKFFNSPNAKVHYNFCFLASIESICSSLLWKIKVKKAYVASSN